MIVHLSLPKMTERLNESAADPPCRSHVSGRRMLEYDFPFADHDLASWSIGQENNTGRDLIRESKDIGSISAGGLDADGVTGHKRTGDGISGRSHDAQHRINNGIVVEPAGELADDAGGPKPTEAGINRRRAT